MIRSEVTLSDDTAQVLRDLDGGVDHFVAALVTEMRDRFAASVHVITGAMRASACVVTPDGSDYAEHVAEAAALNPEAEFASEVQVDEHEAVVQVPVNYAAYEELGTIRRPAHPALVPAVASTLADADDIARKVFGIDGAGA